MHMNACTILRSSHASGFSNSTNNFLKQRHILIFQHQSDKFDSIIPRCRAAAFVNASDARIIDYRPLSVLAVTNNVLVITAAQMLRDIQSLIQRATSSWDFSTAVDLSF